jgi:hypothetical protein
MPLAERLLAGAICRDAFSYRRLLQDAELELLALDAGERPDASCVKDEDGLFPEKDLPFNLVPQYLPPPVPSIAARAAVARAKRENEAKTPEMFPAAASQQPKGQTL